MTDNNVDQAPLALPPNLLPEPREVSAEDLALCKTAHDSLLLCRQLARPHRTDGSIADWLEIDRGHWSCIMRGTKHMPTNKRIAFMRICGNLAPLQYEAAAFRRDLVRQVQTLEQENAALKARLAAYERLSA